METLRCTSKYRKLFGLPDRLPAARGGTTALGPWYANVLNIGSARLLHYMSSTSLLSVVIAQRERRTAEERFVQALEDVLGSLGVPRNFIEAELRALTSFEYARATDRSVLGSMRDQANGATYLFHGATPLSAVTLQLADTPCGPRNYESPRRLAPRLIVANWPA